MSKRMHTGKAHRGRQAATEQADRDALARVRRPTYGRILAIAHANRMSVIDAIDTLADGWDLLTPEQKRAVIVREAVGASEGR